MAIHGLITLYREGEQMKLASESQARDLLRSSSHAADRAAFERRLARQSAFYREIGLQHWARASVTGSAAANKKLRRLVAMLNKVQTRINIDDWRCHAYHRDH